LLQQLRCFLRLPKEIVFGRVAIGLMVIPMGGWRMRLLRLLGLVPILLGIAVIIAGLLEAARPGAVEPHLCSIASRFITSFRRTFVDVPEGCLRAVPFWLASGLAAALIVFGFVWLVWWAEPKGNGARLSVKGPRLHQYPPQRSNTTDFCRMRIHNRGPGDASNVHIRLLDIAPRPRHASWAADYPYPVARVGQPIEACGCAIKRGADELFQVASAWRDSRGEFMAGLDTKSPFHNPTPIEPDECWQMTYEVTADNAEPVRFLLEISVKGGAVAVKRKSARARSAT
jgi:hypothetical protein